MPTNANVFNSRVTSEALEAKFRQVFPAQGGAELVQDLFASGVIQPVVDFSSVAEGSILPEFLQTAWDFATGHTQVTGASATTTLISNTGFWKVDMNVTMRNDASSHEAKLFIQNASGFKLIWERNTGAQGAAYPSENTSWSGVVFLQAGDDLKAALTGGAAQIMEVSYRQIADVNGNLTNPLGFSFS